MSQHPLRWLVLGGTKQTMKYNKSIQLRGIDKNYYENCLKKFALLFDEAKVSNVSYGKQDTRGSESITIHDLKHCVPFQKHFENKWEMLGYIQGVLTARDLTTHLHQFMKKEVN